MEQAGLPSDAIESSLEQRLRYRDEVLRPQYLKITDRNLVEGEVAAVLLKLRAQLDAGEISDSGSEFHARCLQNLDQLKGLVAGSSIISG